MPKNQEKLKDRVVFFGKSPTWIDLVTNLKVGESFPIHQSNANSVRGKISSIIKLKYPDRLFKTHTTTEDGLKFTIIERLR